jgi:hypothetical protein
MMKKIEIQREYYSDTIQYSEIYSRIFNRIWDKFPEYQNPMFYYQVQQVALFGLAQSILETANHKKIIKYIIKKNGNIKEYHTKNIFNIKYGSLDPSFSNFFRIYADYESSIEDYIRLITENQRYSQWLIKYFKNQITFEQAFIEISKIYCPDDTRYFEKVQSIKRNLDTPQLIQTPLREIIVFKLSDLIHNV